MKWKLAVSTSPLSAAISGKYRTTSSSRSMFSFFGRRHCQINRRYSKFDESSCRAVNSSVIEFKDEDNAFSELGPEMSDCAPKKIKLVTEKPEHFAKIDPFGRKKAGSSVSSDCRSRTNGIILTLDSACPTSHPKLCGNSKASTFSDDANKICGNSKASTFSDDTNKISGNSNACTLFDDTNKISYIESSHSISIKNILSTVGFCELVEAISIFGKVTGASFENMCNGLKCCNIKFESVDSSRRAILAGKVAVGDQEYSVQPRDAVDVIAVRIENISQKTSDYAIHSMCKSVGELVGLAKTSKDFVDAFFNMRNDTVRMTIIKKLNNTVIDGCSWSAYTLMSNSSDEGARYKLGSRINDHLSEMRRQHFMQKIDLEDLETLVSGIMHIEEHPPVADLLR